MIAYTGSFPGTLSDEHPLRRYGWDRELAEFFAAHPGSVPARVARVDRGRAQVVTADGPAVVDLTPILVPDPVETPCTGDWIGLAERSAPADRPGLAAVVRAPRRTAVVRAVSSRRSDGQILAANVDLVLVAVGLDVPLDTGRLTRLLTLAWESGARPLVVLTKADIAPDAPHMRDDALAAAPGVDVVVTSTADGSGIDALADRLAGRSTALIGQSGAGKSSLVNALSGRAAMEVQQVRSRDGKGRHTTVTRELIPLPGGGVLLDTPGLRGVGMHGAEDGLRLAFADVIAFADRCRFGDCAHGNEPGCAVREALESGELPAARMDAFLKLERENAHAAARTDARLAAQQRRVWRQRTKDARAGHSARKRAQPDS